jgi:transposase-like protein
MDQESTVLMNGISSTEVPPTEVAAKRRRFTAEYKQRILSELDQCKHGEAGAIYRREGLYYGTVTGWRNERDAGLAPRKRGRKADPATPIRKEKERLERENARLRKRIETAEIIMAAQKKLSEIMGIVLPENDYPRESI